MAPFLRPPGAVLHRFQRFCTVALRRLWSQGARYKKYLLKFIFLFYIGLITNDIEMRSLTNPVNSTIKMLKGTVFGGNSEGL